MRTSVFVYGFWTVTVVVALVSIVGACIAGFRQRGGLVAWRFIKFVSSVLAAVGLSLLLINFEKTAREAVDPKDYVLSEFIDLKFFIADEMMKVCGGGMGNQQAKATCFDVANIDGQVSFFNLRDGKPIEPIKNWQRNPDIDSLIREVNRRLTSINPNLARMAEHSALSAMGRVNFLMIATFVVIFSVAGSIGEAAYQLSIARMQANQARLGS